MGAKASAVAAGYDNFIPASMDELARHYYDYISGMVRKAGIPDQDVPDSVQYILMQLGKPHPVTGKNVIEQFDPAHQAEYDGEMHKTRFSTFLGCKVLLYCRGERGRIFRRDSRELKILDGTESCEGLPGLFGSACDDYSGPEMAEFVSRLRSRLAAVSPRSARDTCDLVALFDEIVAEVESGQIRLDGRISYDGICDRFGISSTTAGVWLSRLRRVIGQELGRPLVTVTGIGLTADQVAAAAEILRGTGGTAVRQPLVRAGHPLADAGKGWYHQVAQAEIRKFPQLKSVPGSKTEHTGHVKAAVIHWLERILAESRKDEPEPAGSEPAVQAPSPVSEADPASARDLVEAELWRTAGIAPADVDRILATVDRVYSVSVCEVSGS